MTGRHRAPSHDSWRTPLAAAAATVGLFGTGGILASAYADTIDVPASDSIGTPPTLTETAEAVRGPRGPLVLPTIGPPERWDPSKGEVLPTSAYVPPPVVEPVPTTEPAATTTTAAVTTTPAPTTTAAPTTTTATTTTVAPTTTVPAPTETTATTTATPTDTTLPTPTLPTVSEETS